MIRVRDFLRRNEDGFDRGAISDFFHVEELQAVEIEKALVSAGYIKFDGRKQVNVLTASGIQLTNATFAKRISRKKAEELVQAVLERADAINLRDELTHRVASVRVFGSYLSDAADLGDIDLAVAFEPRRSSHVEESLERAGSLGRAWETTSPCCSMAKQRYDSF